MSPRHHSRWMQLHCVLLLLLWAAAARHGGCSYVGDAEEADQLVVPEQITTENEQQEGGMEEPVSLGVTQETPEAHEALPKSEKTAVSPWASFSRRPVMSWAGGILLGMVLLYVLMAEKRIAAAVAARAKEREQTLLAVDQRDEINRTAKGEDAYAKVAREELEALEQQKRVAQEKLEALARRRAEIAAQTSTTSDLETQQPSYNEAIEAADERLRKAKKDRDDVKAELDLMEVMKDITDESALAFIEHIRLEREAVEAEDRMCGASLDDMKAVDSPQKAVGVARAQLATLQEILAVSRQEVSELEANAAAPREKVASAKEALEAQLEALRTEKELLEQRLTRESIKTQQLTEMKRSVFAPIHRQHGALKEQLEALMDNFPQKKQGLLEVQENLVKKLADVKEQIAKKAAKGASGDQPLPPHVVDSLRPEERELLEAQIELQRLEIQSFLLADTVVFLTNERERARYAEASNRLYWARTRHSTEQIPEGATDETSASLVELREAEEEADLAWKELNNMNEQIQKEWLSWADLSTRLYEARNRVERAERQVAQQREAAELRLAMPLAFCEAKIELLTSLADDLERSMKRVKKEAFFFQPDIFQHIPENMDAFSFDQRIILPLSADYLQAYETMTDAIVQIRVAAHEARAEAVRHRSTEVLQEMPLEILVATAAAGRGDELQQTWIVEKQTKINEEIQALIREENEAMSTIEELRTAINDLANVQYLSETFPQQRISALAYIIRLEGQVRTIKEIRAKLEAIGQEDIEKEVEDAFRNAAFQGKERRERYGTDPDILLSLHTAVLKALDTQMERIDETTIPCQEQDDGLAPPIAPADLPEPIVPESPEGEMKHRFKNADNVLGGEEYEEFPEADEVEKLGDLVGFTLKNVLQLRKNGKGNP